MNCPHCLKPIPDVLVMQEGSKLMRKRVKRGYDSDKAREAVNARWKKYHESHPKPKAV